MVTWELPQVLAEVRKELQEQTVVIAAVNGPAQTVVSGHKAAVKLVCEKVGAQSKLLSIPHAMHSPLMAPILPELLVAAKSCEPRGRRWWLVCGEVPGAGGRALRLQPVGQGGVEGLKHRALLRANGGYCRKPGGQWGFWMFSDPRVVAM